MKSKNKTLVSIPQEEFEDILCRAAEKGAHQALKDVGLDGENAAEDIRELRSLLSAMQFAKRTALQTFVRIITGGLVVALLAGLAIKLKILTIIGGK